MIKKFILFFLVLFSLGSLKSATCTAIASSNWTNTSTWSCGRVPLCNDIIVIPSGFTVTINSSINLAGGGCSNTAITIGGILFFSGNGSKLDLVSSATITINTGGRITTDQPGNNSQKITIGNGQSEWDSKDGNISGPWVIRDGVSSTTLPIELLDFSATCSSNGVLLNWSTASEIENDYFIIERSEDGITWNSVGKVDGNGTTTEVHKYVHEDLISTNKVFYYRLVQFDFDGKSTTHKIVDANCDVKAKDDLLLYPNPSSTELNALFTMNKAVSGAELKIMNMSGQIVMETKIDLHEGLNSFSFPIDFNSGTYQVIVTTGDVFIPSQKIIVIKP